MVGPGECQGQVGAFTLTLEGWAARAQTNWSWIDQARFQLRGEGPLWGGTCAYSSNQGHLPRPFLNLPPVGSHVDACAHVMLL